MPKIVKMGTSVPISTANSVEAVFLADVLPNFSQKVLRNGKRLASCGLLPREVIGLVVASVLINLSYKEPYTLAREDFMGLDGLLVPMAISQQKRGQRTGLLFEQVYVLPGRTSFSNRLLSALSKKIRRGEAYSENVNLIILTEEDTQPEQFHEALRELGYEMIVHINCLDPMPLHFNLEVLRNTDEGEGFSPCTVFLDKLTGIQQAVVGEESYVIINGVAMKTAQRLPISWSARS